MIESCQCFNEHVDALIPVLVPSGSKEVKCVFKVEIIMAIKVPAYEVLDFLF